MNEKKKIIVVQEDVILGDVLAIKLKKLGYVVDKARDNVSAMQKIRASKPDCVVLDILMSSKGGIELFSQIKADATLRDIPTILTANSEDRDEVKHARELGAREFMIKAVFDPNAVVEKVQQVIAAPIVPTTPGAVIQAQPVVASAPVATTAQTPAPVPAAPASAPVLGKTFVLVIEDDKFLRELLVRKLSSEGFDVQNAIDATAAYAILEGRKPNIILCDLILPEVSGFEILAHIKADPKVKDVPVIILSNLGQKEDTDKAMALGAKDFMVKANFTLDEIVAKIRATLA
jgi:CheY-like chemotaxis protein